MHLDYQRKLQVELVAVVGNNQTTHANRLWLAFVLLPMTPLDVSQVVEQGDIHCGRATFELFSSPVVPQPPTSTLMIYIIRYFRPPFLWLNSARGAHTRQQQAPPA